MDSGPKPASRSRKLRLTRTSVLPVPALADTQAEADGVRGARLVAVGLRGKGAARSSELLLGLLREPFLDAGEVLVVVVVVRLAKAGADRRFTS